MRIAIQGIAGCFSAAAAAALAPGAALVECPSFEAAFAAMLGGGADGAVVPVENSLVGAIAAVQMLLSAHRVRVLGEHTLRIEQCLLVPPDTKLEDVRVVLSHPVALAQCSRFFARHLEWQPMPFFDTAGSVREAVRVRRGDTAAIAGPAAAAAYGAQIVERGIGDREDNDTRFLMITSK